MSSDNPSSADNQQETGSVLVLDPYWVTGFVDGEGCFSVSVHKNAGARWGWQLQPVFQVYQHRDHVDVLLSMARMFGVGKVRPKGGSSSVMTYDVYAVRDLRAVILPFFERYQLHVKQQDFRIFAALVRAIARRWHFDRARFEQMVRLAYAMNHHGKQRARLIDEILKGSSETVRQAPLQRR